MEEDSSEEEEPFDPYDAAELGGNAEQVARILNDCGPRWNKRVLDELFLYGARLPLAYEVQYAEGSTSRVIVTVVQPSGQVSEDVELPLEVFQQCFPGEPVSE